MSNIQICVNAVLPMFIYIVIGAVIKNLGMMSKEENTKFNRILFTFFYPVLLFNNIYNANLADLIDIRLVCFAIAFITAEVLVITAVIVKIEKDNAARGAMIQAIYRSNLVLMGIMVVGNIFGCPPETLYVCDTVQFDDYGKYKCELFSGEDKARWREEHFPEDCRKAREMGARLVRAA